MCMRVQNVFESLKSKKMQKYAELLCGVQGVQNAQHNWSLLDVTVLEQ